MFVMALSRVTLLNVRELRELVLLDIHVHVQRQISEHSSITFTHTNNNNGGNKVIISNNNFENL